MHTSEAQIERWTKMPVESWKKRLRGTENLFSEAFLAEEVWLTTRPGID